MPRISGVSIPENKRIIISLTYIYGIGPSISRKVLQQAGIDENKKTSELKDEEVGKIRQIIDSKHRVEGDLKREKRDNIERLKRIECYRGIRHKRHLPSRGQNTRTNSRTVRGNVRKTAGSGRKGAPSPK